MDKEIRAYFRRVQFEDWLLFNNMAFRLSSYRLRVWWERRIASFQDLLESFILTDIVIVLGQESDSDDLSLYSAGGDDDFY